VTQDEAERNRIGARVWLHLEGEEPTTGVLLSAAEIGAVIREHTKSGVVVLPWSDEGDRWGFEEDTQ
jgi:hypothetical protein